MSVAYLVMRKKLQKLDEYQEEIVQSVYDCLEMFHSHIHKQGKQMKSIEEKLDKAAEQHIKLRSGLSSNLISSSVTTCVLRRKSSPKY